LLKQAISLNPSATTPRTWYAALFLTAKGRHHEAMQHTRQAMEVDPLNPAHRAFSNRGDAFRAKGDQDRAIQDYAEAIRLIPNNPQAFNNRGFTYAAKDDHNRAIRDYDQAIQLNPSCSLAFSNRGLSHFRMRQYDRAIADWDGSLNFDPAQPELLYCRGVAKRLGGDASAGAIDMAAATSRQANIATEVATICASR
jgi:tetratricopeptide (TPR) repeat protein